MTKGKTRRRGFTLIEVLAALGIIIVLTMTLLVTIKSQLDRANAENRSAVLETVNMQIEVSFDQPSKKAGDFNTVDNLLNAGIISSAQLDGLGAYEFKPGNPPVFALK